MKTLTEANLTYEEGKKYIESHECGDCGGGLSLAWGGMWGVEQHVIRCSQDKDHQNFVRPQRLSASEIPGFNLYESKKQRRKKLVNDHGEEKATALARFAGPGQLTQARALEVLKVIWPKASDEAIMKGAMVCFNHGLDPLLKHVHLLPFKNKDGTVEWSVAIGIQASRLMTGQKGTFSYVDDTPRIMSEEEQTKIFGKVDKTHIYAITKLQGSQGNQVVGYGKWPVATEPKGTDKGNSKENMAFIRSERVALDRLSPGTLPPDVEVIDEQFVETPKPLLESAEQGSIRTPSGKVDIDSGEITEPEQEASDNPYADLLVECLQHTIAWQTDKFGKRCHPLSGKDFCNFRNQINTLVKTLTGKLFSDQDAVNRWLKDNYAGKTWSKLSEEEQVEVLGKLDAMANPPPEPVVEAEQASFGPDDIPFS